MPNILAGNMQHNPKYRSEYNTNFDTAIEIHY